MYSLEPLVKVIGDILTTGKISDPTYCCITLRTSFEISPVSGPGEGVEDPPVCQVGLAGGGRQAVLGRAAGGVQVYRRQEL